MASKKPPQSYIQALFKKRNDNALTKCNQCPEKSSGCHWMNCQKHKETK